jgi:DNA-binding transcriptional ArsR family regulator
MAVFTPTASAVDLSLVARYFQVLSDATRLQILQELCGGERKVTELVAAVGGGQSRVSNHLACLRWCGFVATRRAGREIYYSLADPVVEHVVATICREVSGDRAVYLGACHVTGAGRRP